ncbi:hypothetical protein K438DRAFT_1944507 [Mycena galopus ATCC 62051]|nr:hypothetical protein K438DRAFT_1944507 [Mycena galopus ATCC 62051]
MNKVESQGRRGARRRWPKSQETHFSKRSCSRKLEVLDIDARAPENLKVGVRTSLPPRQQGSRDMVGDRGKEREILMQRSVVQYETLQAVKKQLRTYQLLNWMGFLDSLVDAEMNKASSVRLCGCDVNDRRYHLSGIRSVTVCVTRDSTHAGTLCLSYLAAMAAPHGKSGQQRNSTKTKKPKESKGNHGGARQGAGRPRNEAKSQVLGRPPIPPQQVQARTSTFQASSSHRPIAPFFLPRNTNAPVPLGNPLVPSGRSTWSALGPPRTQTAPIFIASTTLRARAQPISEGDLAQLNEELAYIEENDEHADIAAGDRLIDESLVEDSPEKDEENLDAEEAAFCDEESVISKQLHATKTRIADEIKAHEQPLCYQGGDFYDRPPHPVFALGRSLDLTTVYHRKIFVWLPNFLPGHPDHFKCTCGFNNNPIARRVRAMPTDFFLLTNRFICDDRRKDLPGCGTNHQGTDPHIIARLPRFVQVAFPAYISACGAVSKLMMAQMSNTFAARFGPAPFSELVSEIQHRFHADGELMYLSAADFYRRTNVKSFSAFDDPQGYAASPPSIPYLKGLFTDNVSAYRIFIERFIASLSLTVAAGDHTFQLLKYMGDLKGEQLFIAAYTLLNEFEEVRAHSLTQTKSLAFVKELFERIQEGLKKADLPILETTPGIPTTIISDSMEIEDEASDILVDIIAPTSSLSLIALAVKTCPRKEGSPHLEMVQLRTQDMIAVFEVSALTSRSEILPSLQAILTNPSIIKIGHSIRESLQTISDAFSLPEIATLAKAKNAPILDLGKYAKLKGVVDDPSASLSALSGLVLQKSFSLPYHLLYPWSLAPLERNTLLFRLIHKLRNQTIEWIFAHGGQAVVSTSQLISRGENPPVPSRTVSRAFSVPAPPDISQNIPEFTPSIPPATIEFENLTEKDMDIFTSEESDEDDDENFGFDFDEDTEFEGSPLNQDLDEMPGIDNSFFNNTFFDDSINEFWNELVDAQSRSVTDSNLRLYYKLPQQLEAHHKKTILWKSERSTLTTGINFTARKPLLDILNSDDNYTHALPAIPLPEAVPDGELDLSIPGSALSTFILGDNVPRRSFNLMAEEEDIDDGVDLQLPGMGSDELLMPSEEANAVQTEESTVPLQHVPLQPAQLTAPETQPVVQQALLPGASMPTPGPATQKAKAPRCCALCVEAVCPKRHDCKGSGGKKWCMCGHPPLTRSRARDRREEHTLQRENATEARGS